MSLLKVNVKSVKWNLIPVGYIHVKHKRWVHEDKSDPVAPFEQNLIALSVKWSPTDI